MVARPAKVKPTCGINKIMFLVVEIRAPPSSREIIIANI